MLHGLIEGLVRKCARHDRLEKTFIACPPELANQLLNILAHTLLFLRNAPELSLARIAASHAHNLPNLIRDYRPEKLQTYWEADRAFLKKHGKEARIEHLGSIELAWEEAKPIIERHLPSIK